MTSTTDNYITAQYFDASNIYYNGNLSILSTATGYNNESLIINNTFRVPRTEPGEPNPPTQTPYMELKDSNDGQFTRIEINDGTTYVGGNELIRRDDLENIINEDKIIFSNVYIDAFNPGNSYINFLTNASNVDLPPQIGFRVSNGFIEYLHQGESWAKVGSTTETFPTEMYLVTSSNSVPIPNECAGVRMKLVGGGGYGGNPLSGTYSQGAGGGSGGFVDCFLTEDDILNCDHINIEFGANVAPYGSNVSVYKKKIDNTLILVATATGGSPGSNVSLTSSVDGGTGGTGTFVQPNQAYIIPGGTGETGFWSENQNLRYYSGGVGSDSQMGPGGTGASTSNPAGTAYYGGGGGGGLFIPQGMFDPVSVIPAANIDFPGGSGGNPAVLVEFWINQEPWNSNTGGGGGNVTAYFRNLLDVNVTNDPAKTYLKYVGQIAINETLSIVDDLAPQLGGNLSLAGNNILFPDAVSGLVDSTGNLAVAIDGSSSSNSYLVLKSSQLIGGEEIGEITVDNQNGDSDVGLSINTKGSGDMIISTGVNGTIQIATNQLSIDNTTTVDITSGHLTLATTIANDAILSGFETLGNPYVINAATQSSFLVFELTQNDKRYYVELSDGNNGQLLNVIYDSTGSNTEVRLGFRNNASGTYTNKNIGIGSGLVPALKFGISGQSSQMAYIELTDTTRSRWQVLNSGAFVENAP